MNHVFLELVVTGQRNAASPEPVRLLDIVPDVDRQETLIGYAWTGA